MSDTGEFAELAARPPRVPPTLSSVLLATMVLIMTCGVAWYLHGEAREKVTAEIERGLLRVATLAASRVDPALHAQLRRTERKDDPAFERANQAMREVIAIDPEIIYAYTVIRTDSGFAWVLDSEPPADESEMAVVQPYDRDVPPALVQAFETQSPQVSMPYSDEWGQWVSAYAPFRTADGRLEGVIGVDLTLAEFERRLAPIRRATVAISIAGLVASLLIGLGMWWSYRRSSAMQQLGRQMGNLNALLNVSQALGSNIGIDNLLRVIVAKTTAVMRAERSSLFLYEPAQQRLIGRVTEGADAGTEFVIPADRGIAGRVARTGQTANVPEPKADPDFDDAFDRRSGFTTRGILCVPIVNPRKQVLGVLQVLNPRERRSFDRSDEIMLAALAAQAQIAIEREQANLKAAEVRKLEDTLKLAQAIQLGMLPNRFDDLREAGVDLHARLIPARMVGGDFYDFILTDDRKLGMVIADVSGKGVPAALLMAKAMTLLRSHLAITGDPAEALHRANEELAAGNDQAMFVTVFVALCDLRSGVMTYSNAGHNHPLIVRDGDWQEIDGAKSVPLGAHEQATFANAAWQMRPRDILFLYTDGVTEAMNPEHELFGEERLYQYLIGYANESMSRLVDTCVDSVNSFARGAEQSDDITVLAMRMPERR